MRKKEYFTKTNIQRKFFNMVRNNYNTTISMIQQYDIYNLEIHAGKGLELALKPPMPLKASNCLGEKQLEEERIHW